MKYLFLSAFLLINVHAQTSPKIDPNKFTICAITINSDDEKKIFQAQVAKNTSKFNPIVELTDMGDDNEWFKKACESKIKCDQLVISGHFGGEFFSDNPDQNKSLSLAELEKAGCSKSCEGILNDPYEVFLLGCNTLAGKDLDNRTPAEYLRVLLNDGFSASQAELVVQSRYGAVGDSNKGSMQRAFAGAKKNIYGFDSIGPSGKTIKPFLTNYFSKISLPNHLEKLQAKRLMNAVQSANTEISGSMNGTAFTQCNEGSVDDPVTKKICTFQDERVSNTEKLALITEVLSNDSFLTYLPSISHFLELQAHSFNDKEKADLKLITENATIKRQILGLLDKTNSLGLKLEWSHFAMKLGYLSEAEASSMIQKDIEKMFSKPIGVSEKDTLCGGDFHNFDINLRNESIKTLGKLEVIALACLNVQDPPLIKRLAQKYEQVNDPEQDYDLLSLLTEQPIANVPLSPKLLAKVKGSLTKPEDWQRRMGVSFLLKFTPQDKSFIPVISKLLQSKNEEDVESMLWEIGNLKVKDPEVLKEVISLTKSKNEEIRATAIRTLVASELKAPWIQKPLLDFIKSNYSQYWYKKNVLDYIVSIKPVSTETLEELKSIKTEDLYLNNDIDNAIKKLESP